MRSCNNYVHSERSWPGPRRPATLLALALTFAGASASALTVDLGSSSLTLTPGGTVGTVATAGSPTCDGRLDSELWTWSGDQNWSPSAGTTSSPSSTFSYSDPGTLEHCDALLSTIDVTAFCRPIEGNDYGFDDGSATVTVNYENPLTIPNDTQGLAGSPGATVSFTASFSGGRAPFSTTSTTPLGGTARIAGTQVTYEYQIPLNTQPGTLNDTVTINGATTSCGGDSAQIAVAINVLPGPTIAPDPINLQGAPGAEVTAALSVSGGTAGYSWTTSKGGCVNPSSGPMRTVPWTRLT